jgi:hypothetical protein
MWKVRFHRSAWYALAGSQEVRNLFAGHFIFQELSRMSRKPTEPGASATGLPEAPSIGPISPAQLAANRANAQLSTGPRTEAGRARSSQNAVKSALTGRTVLLPTDDRDEYARFLADFQQQLKPIGPLECELVQIIVDCHWRLRRTQELEFALYAHGHDQFEPVFQGCAESERGSRILLQTHLTYEKQFRNLHIQEARIDRKRAKAVAELQRLQAEREPVAEPSLHDLPDNEASALLEVGQAVSPARAFSTPQNGFVFSNAPETTRSESAAVSVDPLLEAKAA